MKTVILMVQDEDARRIALAVLKATKLRKRFRYDGRAWLEREGATDTRPRYTAHALPEEDVKLLEGVLKDTVLELGFPNLFSAGLELFVD